MAAEHPARVAPMVSASILILAALYVAEDIFAPVAFSLFLIAIVWPVQQALERVLPRLVALVLTVLLAAVSIFGLGAMVVWGFSSVAHWLFDNAGRFQALYLQATAWLEEHDLMVTGPWTERFDMFWAVRVLQRTAGHLNTLIAFSLLVFIFMLLGLLEVRDYGAKLAVLEKRGLGHTLMQSGRRIGEKYRRYMLVRTAASVATGLAFWGFTLAMGLDLAAAWGVIAFALNYLPFIGSLVATLLPTLFSAAQTGTWQAPLAVLAGLNVIQFIIGSYLEPRISGAALSISPFVVLFSVFFWSFMWGIPGAFIGVPITIAALTICEQSRDAAWIATLLRAK